MESIKAKPALKKDDHKFSKLLISHCRENRHPIPEGEFLDLLDDYANGKVDLYCDEEVLTQENPSDLEETQEDTD